jgi:hypothetical protein
MLGAITSMRGGDGTEMLALARLGCEVPQDSDDAPIFAAIRTLIDVHDRLVAADVEDRRRIGFLILATTVARTPDVPLPARVPEAPLPPVAEAGGETTADAALRHPDSAARSAAAQ